ncbi:hypothetical protein ACER0C_002043 [Sarotherodon galilaeus]
MADKEPQGSRPRAQSCSSGTGHKRAQKYTERGLEEQLGRHINARRSKLSQLTAKMNKISGLMKENESLDIVDEHLSNFSKLHEEFLRANDDVLSLLPEDERNVDQMLWFNPKKEQFSAFMTEVEKWIMVTRHQHQNDVSPDDSVSVTARPSAKKSGTSVGRSSVSSRSSRSSRASSVSSVRQKEEAERAALLARAASLKQRQALDIEECKLKARREQLEIETAIAASTAKIKVLEDCEYESCKNDVEQCESAVKQFSFQQPKVRGEHDGQSKVNGHSVKQEDDLHQTDASVIPMNLCEVMLKQNDITEMLVKQHRLSHLPQRDIPIFSGDPLEFIPFIRAFDHTIHDKTDSDSDRLYYLEQFTRGEPRDLVRSCQHMSPQQGYSEARKLLFCHYGNELRIATAYMNRAFDWPQIKTDDAKALHSYSLFLTGCNNAMQDISQLQEMESPTNLRVIVSKLPYKMREMWRVSAFDIQETSGRRAKFSDLVRFINRQAKIAADPLFGDIKDAEDKAKSSANVRMNRSSRQRGSTFATSVTQAANERSPEISKSASCHTSSASQKPCIYCEKLHTLAEWQKVRNQPYKERLEFLKAKGLCFACLTQGHLSKDCKKRSLCEYCSKRHPSMLHRTREEDSKADDCIQRNVSDIPTTSDETHISGRLCGATGAGKDIHVLSIVPVWVKLKKGNKLIETYAFMDNGSQATFCSEKLMRQLGVEGKKTKFMLRTMGQEKLVTSYHLSGLEVCGLNENTYIDLPDIYTHADIPVSRENIPTQDDLKGWPHLRQIKFPRSDADIGLLIGCDVHKAMEPWEIIHSKDNGPYAVRTILGWVINGPLKRDSCSTPSDSELSVSNLLMQQLNYDFPEKASEEKQEMSREDIMFMDSVNGTVERINGHYSIGLPLRNKAVKMPNNRSAVMQRAENLKRKLIRNTEFHKEYQSFMSDLLNRGYAVQVPNTKTTPENERVWYIPHHGMYHPQKRKLRVVFDCAASFQGKSLNEELLQGPDLTNTLIGVLTRFRWDHIALMSDIEAMYHQVRVPPEDSDLLRFLWWPNGNLNEPLQEYKMMVHLFGATSSPSCVNYALKKAAEDAKEKMPLAAVNAVLNNFYVDDCLLSVSDETEACTMVRDLTALCESGGFHLTKWMSNSRVVLASIPEQERAKEIKDLDLRHDALPDERVLGVNWCTETDVFKIRINEKPMPKTRRGILSFVSAIYDPLGFLSPVILPAKIILRELCGRKISWDEEIPAELAQASQVWHSELSKLHGFTVNRCLKPAGFGVVISTQLHHFADASERGYGVVTYLRITNQKRETHCSFIIGKSRVSPLKQITIPRLELTAAAVAVKMDKLMRKELQMPQEESVFWSDSTTVLKYISSENIRFKTFVANRVSLIRDNTKPSQWMYVNSELNPADHASRGMNTDTFMKCSNWIAGPEFLTKDGKNWPIPPDIKETPKNDVEVKEVMSVDVTKLHENPVNKLISHYSDWYRLKKAVSWILMFKQLLCRLSAHRKLLMSQASDCESGKRKAEKVAGQMQQFKTCIKGSSLTTADVAKGETEIVKFCQNQSFAEELASLQKGDKLKRSSHIAKLDPFVQDGVLRVGGRLHESALPADVKHPLILPKGHHVSTLILRHIHQETGHGGRNYTLSRLRERFWIPQADSAIRKILSKCVTCRRTSAKPGEQRMANLPQDRLIPDKPPFTNVGIDYFGPFEVKHGRSRVKRYGVLFTCLAVRAIHIEVAHSLETDSCINAFRRFIARRGQVSVMRSDNGTNLVGAEKEMREAIKGWNHSKISEMLMQKGITWIFNPPAGSHFGGIWERQIRSVRRILNQILKQQPLDDECLQTLLCEVEAIVNGRPITRASNDPNDLDALTPNHLLLLKGQPVLPPGLFHREDSYAKKRWRQVQYLSDIFWKRWTKEYLPLLQERQKWLVIRRNLRPGDVVLIVDDSAPRSSWLMGKVESTVPDSHGLVRRVFVKTKTSVLERPIDKLCLLLEMEATV